LRGQDAEGLRGRGVEEAEKKFFTGGETFLPGWGPKRCNKKRREIEYDEATYETDSVIAGTSNSMCGSGMDTGSSSSTRRAAGRLSVPEKGFGRKDEAVPERTGTH